MENSMKHIMKLQGANFNLCFCRRKVYLSLWKQTRKFSLQLSYSRLFIDNPFSSWLKSYLHHLWYLNFILSSPSCLFLHPPMETQISKNWRSHQPCIAKQKAPPCPSRTRSLDWFLLFLNPWLPFWCLYGNDTVENEQEECFCFVFQKKKQKIY